MLIEKYCEANAVEFHVTKCPHCNCSGYLVEGLKPGFVRVEDSAIDKLRDILRAHPGYWWIVKIAPDDESTRSWYEIGPYHGDETK